MGRDDNGESPYAGANALLQATAALNKATAASEGVERVVRLLREDVQRVARASEATNALAETEVRDSKLAAERAVEAFEKVPVALAVLAVAVQLSATQSTEAKTEARRAADNSRTDIRLPERDAPRHSHGEEDSSGNKGAPGAARLAWRDFLRAPTGSRLSALLLVMLVLIAALAAYAIKNGYRAQELEHESAPIHSKEK